MLEPQFKRALEQEARAFHKSESPPGTFLPLLRTITSVSPFRAMLAKGSLTLFLWMVLYILQPLYVRAVLSRLEGQVDPLFGALSPVALWALITVSSLCMIVAMNHGFFRQYRHAFASRLVLQNAVFEKATRLACHSKVETSTGKIVTLMSIDPNRIFMSSTNVNWLWMGPTLMATAMALVVSEIGLAGLCMVGVLLFLVICQAKVARLIGTTRQALVRHTDERLKMTEQVLVLHLVQSLREHF